MKILHIIYDDVQNPWVGGGGALRALEINRILAKKHDITTITGNFPKAESGSKDNIRFIRTGYGKNYFLSRLTFTLLMPFQFRKQNFDLVVNEFSAFSPCYCHWFTRKPVVHTFYHILGKNAMRKFFLLGVFAYIFEKIFLATARSIITISPSVTQIIEKPGDKRKIRCIYTGISPDLFDVEPRPGEYIAFLGRLDIYMKGLDILLEAFSRIKDSQVCLKIAGSGPEKNIAALKEIVKRLKLENRVEFLGRISDKDKKLFLSKSFFTVMPSRFEGWGISAIESSSCGKAVIGTRIPGLQDAIHDGETGILVESGDVRELSSAMMKLLDDEKLRTGLGKNGKIWAQNFGWEKIAEKQEDFYKEILDS